MKRKVIIFPNQDITNLHGRMGERIMKSIRAQTVKSDDNIRKVAEEYKARVLAERRNGQ